MFIAFYDSYLAGCANLGRQMLGTDIDLKSAFDDMENALPDVMPAVNADGHVVWVAR
jgi:hypothetical protein